MDDPSGIPTGWGAFGAGIGAAITGLVAWFAGRGRRALETSEAAAGTVANQAIERVIVRLEGDVRTLRADLEELQAENDRMRVAERRMIVYVGELVRLLRAAGIEPPPMPEGVL